MKLLLGRNRTYRVIPRTWPRTHKRTLGWLMPVELLVLVPILVIFGIAQPDMYRTDMWRIGFENKLNSNPDMVLYAYANYRALPNVPFIWSLALTNFNVAISIISLFFLLVRLICYIMRVWYPILAVVVSITLVTLYTVSVYGQIGPDYADSRYPAPAAWYFRQGCGLAKRYGKYNSCQVAQSSLGVTLLMLIVCLVNLGVALHAMWPNKENDQKNDEDEESTSPLSKEGSNWEMHSMKSPAGLNAMPYTPRTQAFYTLDRQMPQRQPHQAYA
ncbi:uncharacterized protein HRG_06546 [Hirsutella rhossiliensis]|uniref:Uncharacterized protein n=1 Tax=Hirsutella rhossiliensis TaxID=111463 RepID=A0A9P8MXZ2_9HYPO|nr:uncharacterized protein HRG_06546 [Hirsutella rhossiliensis]KAH0962444.1 hypothetical protein HRG_06546 [Hirsutella rhossiliensis]